jgi:predicted AAA+ superfamily ATPase
MGDLDHLLFRGFLPPVTFLKKEPQIATWWKGYIQSYLEKDLRDLARIAYLPDFRRMMELIGLRCGQILKQSEIARDAGLSQATAGRYINLLEVSGLLLRLRPYHRNISKRLIKSPKLYFVDPGLVCAVCGYKSKKDLPAPFRGALFESFVLLNLLSIASRVGGTLSYFRTQGGKEREVDFILEFSGKLIAVEAKHATRVGFRDLDNLLFFRDLVPSMEAGILLYAGKEVRSLGRNIYAVPWQALA